MILRKHPINFENLTKLTNLCSGAVQCFTILLDVDSFNTSKSSSVVNFILAMASVVISGYDFRVNTIKTILAPAAKMFGSTEMH